MDGHPCMPFQWYHGDPVCKNPSRAPQKKTKSNQPPPRDEMAGIKKKVNANVACLLALLPRVSQASSCPVVKEEGTARE
jgi:hypothetical protein